MSSFDEIFQDLIKLRKERKAVIKDTITKEELDAIQRRAHVENTFIFNTRFGSLGKSNNANPR